MADFSYWKVLTRRKTLSSNANQESDLSRVMNTFDLTTLGIGATLGVGVYVLAGHVSRDQAGPSVILSFTIAAVTSLLAGLCYAEFGARVPKAGSAYIYSYVCIGEFVAFIVGWNLMLEYIIGSASVSKGISLYLDTLINDTLKNTFMEISPINWGFLGLYFDWFAFATAFSFGICLAFGIQTSTIINNLLTILNIIIVVIVVVAGAFKADIKNWQIDPASVNVTANHNLGSGGFFPFGIEGTLRGAATCFFGFVGFDCIATTGEEVKDPQRAIPRSILFTLLIIFLAYFSVATVLTLMWPYYLQDVNAPLPFVFQEIDWQSLKWIVTIGGMIGLIASLFGAMFPLPRIIYAMSQDGLVFRFLGKISTKFKTPVTGTICAALLTGLMAGLFELTQLVNMLSIGTLLAYTVVAISITILRFMDNLNEENHLSENINRITPELILKQIINFQRIKTPNDLSTRIVGTVLLFYCLCCFIFSLMIMYVSDEIINLQPWAVGIIVTLLIILLLLLCVISMQPREEIQPGFKVPFLPIIPGISIFVNVYLMLQLDIYTWIRFGIWMFIGIIIYTACFCMYKKNEFENNSWKSSIPINNGKISFINPSENFGNNIKPNGTIAQEIFITNTTDSQALTKSSTNQSLDEIILESELSHNHKEIKNPNGKSFFIESSMVPESEKIGNGEDAKSAIAILDDVLKNEESVTIVHELNNFNRKTSVDSEMIPSFIEASTVATVHKSYESLREEMYENWNDENDSKNDQAEYNDFIIINTRSDKDILNLNKCENFRKETKLSQTTENVDELHKVDSDSLPLKESIKQNEKFTVERINSKHNKSRELKKICSNHDKLSNESNVQKLCDATFVNEKSQMLFDNEELENTSLQSLSEIVDPIHSKTFKDRLNQLISKRSLLTTKSRQYFEGEKDDLNTQNVVLREIIAENNETLKSEDTQSTKTFDDNTDNGNSIPTAPKFDPILYNTLGRHKYFNKRPEVYDNFEKLPASEPDNNTIDNVTVDNAPFKIKLEAILRRGPSYKIIKSRTPTVIKTNTKSEDVKRSSKMIDENKEKFTNVLNSLQDKTQISKRWKLFDSSRPVTIEDALKSLKPVAKITSTTN